MLKLGLGLGLNTLINLKSEIFFSLFILTYLNQPLTYNGEELTYIL